VGSIYTLWAGPDMIMDRRLVGAWRDSSSTTWFQVSATGPFTYRVVMHDDSGKSGSFLGLLGRINGRLVLDVQPDVTPLRVPQAYAGLLQPMHGFLFLDSVGTRPRVSILDPDSLSHYIIAHPGAIRADTLSAGVVLEGAPHDIQTFLSAYVRRPGVISEQLTLVRRAP
jgi:hypothetical protein